VQELQHAAELTGSSIEGIETGTKKMTRFLADIGEGSKPAIKTLETIGLKADDLKGKNLDEQFIAIAEAIAKVKDPILKGDAAMTIFGKTGTALLPMLADGAEGFAKYRKEAHDLGLVMSEEDVKAAADLQDKFDNLEAKMGALQRVAGTVLLPVMSTFADVLLDDVFPAIEKVANMLGTAWENASKFGSALADVTGIGEKTKGLDVGGAVKAGVLSAIPGASQLQALASVADVLGFDSGGVVPGPRGAPQLAMVHGGETILPTHRGATGSVVNITIQGDVLDEPDFVRKVQQALNSGKLRFGGAGY
jgi:hypothetical protein